jgi:hypothetical protein
MPEDRPYGPGNPDYEYERKRDRGDFQPAPMPRRCRHCGSLECGPVRCRFSLEPQ